MNKGFIRIVSYDQHTYAYMIVNLSSIRKLSPNDKVKYLKLTNTNTC